LSEILYVLRAGNKILMLRESTWSKHIQALGASVSPGRRQVARCRSLSGVSKDVVHPD